MMRKQALLCVLLLSWLMTLAPACHTPLALQHIPGNIHLAGLFPAHSGVNCSTPESKGQQQLATAVFVIQTLREINYIPGIQIGLSVYDTCSSPDVAHKAIINALVQADCLKAISLGCFTEQDVAATLTPLLEPLGTPVTALSDSRDVVLLSQLGVEVLMELDWTVVDWLLASSESQLLQFVSEASQHRICIRRQTTLADLVEIPEGNLVVIADWADLENSLRISPKSNLLLIPLDGEVNFKSDRLPRETYTLVPSLLEVPTTENSTAQMSEAIQAPLLIQIAADILQILNLFKSNLAAFCPPATICDAFSPSHQHVTTRAILKTPHLVTYVLSALQMSTDEFDGYTVYHKIPDDSTFYEHFGSFKIIQDKWVFVSEEINKTTTSLCRNIPSDNVTGIDCSDCVNFDEIYHQHFEEVRKRQTLGNMVVFRSESWVAAIVSVSAVGVVCCIAIAVFILIRLCKRDILEGNPSFSFLLLLSIIFTYGSILPFSFTVVDDHHFYKGIFCAARLFGTSLSYALIFSIMLARSLMLASCDQDGGFMSHINGYHQTVLCFFIAAVQVGLSVQFWAVNWRFLPQDQCSPMTNGYLFILSLCYDMFLLVLLVFTSPFIVRSKRNYHEGSFFAVSSILCMLVWFGWITGYVIFPEEYNDIFVVSGLCGTATVLLVTIFIPRTYLMVTGIVRDHLASALPSLAYQSSNSVVDVNYRSTQALYDSVNPIAVSRGQSNPNFYSDRPNTPSTSKMDTIPHIRTISPLPDNTYERYGSPPSPLNVTRF